MISDVDFEQIKVFYHSMYIVILLFTRICTCWVSNRCTTFCTTSCTELMLIVLLKSLVCVES